MSNKYFKELREEGGKTKFPAKFFFCNETVSVEDSIKLYVKDFIEKTLTKDIACSSAEGLLIYLELFEFEKTEKEDLEDPDVQYFPVQVKYNIKDKTTEYDVNFDITNTKEVLFINVYYLVVKSIQHETPKMDTEDETHDEISITQ